MLKKIVFLICVFVVAISIYSYIGNRSCYSVPITFSPASLPRVPVKIEDRFYAFELDLGSKHSVVLRKSILDNLKKTSYGTIDSRNFKGTKWVFPTYRIPCIKIGKMTFKDKIAVEKSDEAFDSALLFSEETPDQTLGLLGRALFEKTNLLIDPIHHMMLGNYNKKKLKKSGYDFSNFTKVPFVHGRSGFIITVNTDWGNLKLLIDTGATFSHIRTSHSSFANIMEEEHGLSYIETQHFVIGEKDFGEERLYLLDITQELSEIDGILGMDFLRKHIMYVDQDEQRVYFGN